MHFNPEADGPGFYAVTRYHDIREVHRNVQIYSSELGGTSLEDLDPDQIEARKSMLDMDPPRHDELRGLIARRFTPRAVQVWEEAVGRSPTACSTWRCRSGSSTSCTSLLEIPMHVFAELMGVPQEERRYMFELGDQLLGGQDPEFAQPSEDVASAVAVGARRREVISSAASWPPPVASNRARTSSPSSRSSV